MAISLRISHSSAIVVLNVLIGVILSHPLCGTMDEAQNGPSNTPPTGEQGDRIHFTDLMNVRTIEVNGTRITCFSEATNTTDTGRSFSGNVPQTFETQINSGKLINSLALILSGLTNAVDNNGPNLPSMPFAGTRRNQSAYPLHTIPTRFQPNNNHQHFHSNPTFLPNDRDCLTKNQPYCLTTPNYPASLIDDLIRKSSHKFESAFGSDAIELVDIGTRNNANDEEQLCDSYEEVIYPLSGEREDTSNWLIVNTNKYRQGVRVARCLNPSKPCRMTEAFPNFYRTECKQHFVYRELVAVTPEGNTIKDKFKFPACCTCVLRKL